MEARKRFANQNDGCVFLPPTAIVMLSVAILQRATVKPYSIIAHEKGVRLACILVFPTIIYQTFLTLTSHRGKVLSACEGGYTVEDNNGLSEDILHKFILTDEADGKHRYSLEIDEYLP